MDITVQELKTKLDAKEEFLFIDVREMHEFEEFNLGAKLIPLGDFMMALPEMEGYKKDEVVIHCRSGKRSAMAQHLMKEAGFENVRNLTGGVLAWQEAFGS